MYTLLKIKILSVLLPNCKYIYDDDAELSQLIRKKLIELISKI